MWAGVFLPVSLILLIFLSSRVRIEAYRDEGLTVTVVLPLLSYQFSDQASSRKEPRLSTIRRAARTVALLVPIRHSLLYILNRSDVSYKKFKAESSANLATAINSVLLETSLLAFLGAYARTVSAERDGELYGLKYKICIKTRAVFLFNSLFIFLYYTVKGYMKKRLGSVG